MSSRAPKLLLLASAAALWAGAAVADETADAATVSEVVVTRAAREPVASATGLPISIRETPQSVTIIAPEQIRDFALTNVNELLAQAPGVNVEEVETDRTYYNARGFDITNFQFDGVGLPMIWSIQFGQLDTVMFERVEVVRGANSIMTGVGNPSATINYVRKRPTAEFRGALAAQAGEWDMRRIEADVSGPLNASGSLRGRLVAAGQAGESYLDHYQSRRGVFYGVAAWDVSPALTLTGGFFRHDHRADGVLWGALPLMYADGAPIPHRLGASTSADWTYWDVLDQTAFVEAAYALPQDWRLKAVATYRSFDEDAKLLYAFGNPDPQTGLGVMAMSGIYPSFYRQQMFDLVASGPLRLLGRDHQLALGLSAARGTGKEHQALNGEPMVFPALGLWGRQPVAEPAFTETELQASTVDRLYRAYVSARLSLADRLHAVVGATALKLETRGFSYGADMTREESKVSPYLGLVYDLSPQLSLYASYTDIFNPQSEVDVARARLEAAHGKSYEAGFKAELFDRRLYLSGAVYQAEQLGLAETAGVFEDTGKPYHEGLDTKVTGFELEAAGRITEVWTLSGGYSDLEIQGPTDAPIRTYIPRRIFKAATTYAFPRLRNLKLGAAVRWQDEIWTEDVARFTQDAYAVVDLTASVDVTRSVRATLNLKNAGDERYMRSLQWNQAYHAAPRNVSLRLDYVF